MKKIDDTILVEMADRGEPQKVIAQHFAVSEAAISKRLKRLRMQNAHAAVLSKLTEKEKVFVAEICSGTSQTQSALAAFDVGSIDSAKSIGNRLMKDSDIQRAISSIMEEQGLTRTHLIRRLKSHVDGPDAQVSIRGIETGLKLFDAFPSIKNLNLNVNADVSPVDLSKFGFQK